MDVEAKKSELHSWINRLKDQKLIDEMIRLKEESENKISSKRKFGDGKHIVTYVADDFNDPIDFGADYRP